MYRNIFVEQPYLEETLDPIDRYIVRFSREIRDIIGFNEFRSSIYPNDIDTIVHELNELFLYSSSILRKSIRFHLNGKDYHPSVAHILSSLIGGSTLNGVPLSPEDVDEHLLHNCKLSKERWRNRT